MDRIAREGVLGRSRNVPDRFLPGSDVATLSLFGYDPVRYYTGRAPLEAVAMGIPLGPDDWAVRCNLMTILDGRMTDFTAGHITSEEGADAHRGPARRDSPTDPRVEFHAGVSYRNAMIYRGAPGERPVRRRHEDHPAARRPGPARRRPPAAGAPGRSSCAS